MPKKTKVKKKIPKKSKLRKKIKPTKKKPLSFRNSLLGFSANLLKIPEAPITLPDIKRYIAPAHPISNPPIRPLTQSIGKPTPLKLFFYLISLLLFKLLGKSLPLYFFVSMLSKFSSGDLSSMYRIRSVC